MFLKNKTDFLDPNSLDIKALDNEKEGRTLVE